MSDLLEVGQKWLGGKLKDHASQSVTYKRDADEAVLQATVGKSTYEQHDGEGVVIKSQVRDFLIDTADLLLSAIGSLPRRGDRIHQSDGDETIVYEVMSLGSAPPWRFSDPFRLKLRIHTKQIDTLSA